MLKIVCKKPNESPYIMEIENSLEKIQSLVDGYIEVIPANEDGTILMITNEEGKLRDLEPNVWIENTCIVGNIVFVQNKGDGEFHSLTDEMAKAIIKSLK